MGGRNERGGEREGEGGVMRERENEKETERPIATKKERRGGRR